MAGRKDLPDELLDAKARSDRWLRRLITRIPEHTTFRHEMILKHGPSGRADWSDELRAVKGKLTDAQDQARYPNSGTRWSDRDSALVWYFRHPERNIGFGQLAELFLRTPLGCRLQHFHIKDRVKAICGVDKSTTRRRKKSRRARAPAAAEERRLVPRADAEQQDEDRLNAANILAALSGGSSSPPVAPRSFQAHRVSISSLLNEDSDGKTA